MKPVAFLRDEALTIFLFHGVIEQHRHAVRNYTRKHIDRAQFRSVLEALCAAGTPISMDDVIEATSSGYPLPPRSFAITFDDGFQNNLTVAAPVLRELKVPATFYVTTLFIEQNAMSWIDRIEWCVENTPRVALPLPWSAKMVEAEAIPEKVELLAEIRSAVKSNRAINVEEFVSTVFAACGRKIESSDDPLDRKLSWHEVRELANDPLFQVGGHSHTHPILSFLSPAHLAEELDVSLNLLKDRADVGPRHYSYPEGLAHCYSPEVISALQQRGVVCCPTAEHGTNPLGTSLFHLKRIMVV